MFISILVSKIALQIANTSHDNIAFGHFDITDYNASISCVGREKQSLYN
jgi:hypothetical protein